MYALFLFCICKIHFHIHIKNISIIKIIQVTTIIFLSAYYHLQCSTVQLSHSRCVNKCYDVLAYLEDY